MIEPDRRQTLDHEQAWKPRCACESPLWASLETPSVKQHEVARLQAGLAEHRLTIAVRLRQADRQPDLQHTSITFSADPPPRTASSARPLGTRN